MPPEVGVPILVVVVAAIVVLVVMGVNPRLVDRAKESFLRALADGDDSDAPPGIEPEVPEPEVPEPEVPEPPAIRQETPYEVPHLPDVYTDIRYISAGGFGTVYAAHDTSLNQDVAVKVVKYDRDDPNGYIRLLGREVRHLSRVRHPVDIPRLIRADLEWVRPHYAMELIDGENLYTYVTNRGPLTGAAEIARLFGTVGALVELQDLGIMHRDITPKNIMVAGDRTVLLDLGVGRATDSTSTRTAGIAGLPPFMAPEVLLQGKEASPTSEIYSWGVTLAYAVTGLTRYRTDTDRLSDRDDPTFIAALAALSDRGPWHRELVKLIANCTAKDPAERVTDADDLACVTKALQSMVRMSELGRLRSRDAASIIAKRTIRNVSDQVFERALRGFDPARDSREWHTYVDEPVNGIVARLAHLYPTRNLLQRGVSAPFLYGLVLGDREHIKNLGTIRYEDSHHVPSKWVRSMREVGIDAEQTKDGLIRVRPAERPAPPPHSSPERVATA